MKKILKKPVSNESFLELVSHLPALDMYKGPWIAGGSARRLWMEQDWNQQDLDVFFPDDLSRHVWCQQLSTAWCEQTTNTVAPMEQITWNTISCSSHDRIKNSTARHMELVIQTDNADTYNLFYDCNIELDRTSLQLIKKYYNDNICKLWDDFDFTVSCFATDGKQIWAWENSVQDALDMKVNINNPHKKDNFALRVVKHHAYGFEIGDHLLMEAADLISRGEYQWPINY